MTEAEIRRLRQKISKLFAEYGRVKGFLEMKGTKINTPQSIFLVNSESPKDSFMFEVDGLNQVWNTTEKLRDTIEDIIDHHENVDFGEIDKLIDSWLIESNDSLADIERSIIVKTEKR